jgi:putative transposase
VSNARSGRLTGERGRSYDPLGGQSGIERMGTRGVQELDQAARRRGPWLSIAQHDSIAVMLASLLYPVLRRLLAFIAPNDRSDHAAQIEILVLRHQLGVLRRQVKRPVYRRRDRALLAAASRILPKEHWGAFLVRPETLLRWHRSLVARKWTRPHRPPGRPAIDPEVCKLILQMARENPRWGYIKGELGKLGIRASATSIAMLLRRS